MGDGVTDSEKESHQALPPVGMNVIVQCDGMRCLAYRSADGKWRATFTQEEIKNVIQFFPVG